MRALTLSAVASYTFLVVVEALHKTVSKVRRSIEERGSVDTALLVARNIVYPFRVRLSPTERRLRKVDRDFDRRFGTDTAGEVSASDLGFFGAAVHRHRYGAAREHIFEQIMESVAVDLSQFTCVDIGSGKGRVLLLASSHPFGRIIGVEVSSELHECALKNIEIYKNPNQRCRKVESVCHDGTNYPLPDTNLFVFLYNPFGGPLMEAFVDSFRAHLAKSSKQIFVAYVNPEYIQLFDAVDGLERITRTGLPGTPDDWVLYHRPARSA